MKKIIIILSVYTVLIFAVCMGTSAFYGHIPEILCSKVSFAFRRGLLWFLNFLPIIFLSGLTVSCCVQWKKNSSEIKRRFSREMLLRFRNALFVSIALAFVLSINQEIFVPTLKKSISNSTNAPFLLKDALKTSENLYSQNELKLALQYVKKAQTIAPKSQEANALFTKILDSMEVLKTQKIFEENEETEAKAKKLEKPLQKKDESYSVAKLLELSYFEAQKKNWFNAHYYANLAVEACSGTNTNLEAAVKQANYAWNMLNRPIEEDNALQREIFSQKRKAYTAFYEGDYLESYYIFADLKFNREIEDKDVERFFALAQEQVENQYFFFDETDNMATIKNGQNIYFSLFYPDGSRNLFFMKGILDMKKDGGLVRYIEGLTLVNYLPDGKFNYYFTVPYAKVISQSVSAMNDDSKKSLGINNKWENVPLIQLCSVDRKTENLICCPKVYYEESGLPEEIKSLVHENSELDEENNFENSEISLEKSECEKEFNSMILPLSFDDFALFSEDIGSPGEMSILKLIKFIPKASNYGFAEEIYTENLISRLFFSFFILIMLLFAAGLGWNYRVSDEDAVFKFVWIFVVILFGVAMAFVYEFALYFFNVTNYVLVGLFAHGAILAAFILYTVLLFLVSLIFCAHKS